MERPRREPRGDQQLPGTSEAGGAGQRGAMQVCALFESGTSAV